MPRSRPSLMVPLCLAVLFAPCHARAQEPAAFAIVGARIFDGSRTIPRGTVVVAGGRIAAVGPDVKPPAGARVIDAAGATLLPGLIDAHTHTWGDALVRALQFGVTTELDMFTAPGFAAAMRAEQERTGAPERADLKSAGFLATAPGGHGTQYGIPVPTLTRPEEAQAWVDARIAEGSDYIKIIWEDGSVHNRSIPSLDRALVAALIRAAHQRRKLAVVHASTQPNARAAIEEGADGLVHIFSEQAPDPGFVALAAERKAFVIPTLTVIEGTSGGTGGADLSRDPRLAPYLRPDEAAGLGNSVKRPGSKRNLAFSVEAVRQLHAAGVAIVAGSDAPNPGTVHGASIHRELEMLVQAGLTPAQALAAATSVPAKAFRLEDRGRIAPGLKADLVLVQGDPTADVKATRDLLRIWKAGREVERQRIAAPAAASAAPAKRSLTLEDLWALERPGAASLSPDGSQVVYTVTRWSVEENKADTDLWLVPADGSAPPRRLTWNPDPDNRPVWSPDGRRIAFVSKRGDAPPQLYVLSLDGGEAQPVTKLPVAVQGPKWFRDGKRIGFVASTWPDLNGDWTAVQKRLDERKADKVQARISDTRLLRFWNEYRTDGRCHHVFSVELDSGEVRDLTPGLERTMDFLSPEGAWDVAPEGDEIAYSANSTEPPYGTMNYDVFVQKVGGEPRNVSAANPAADLTPRYSPDGRWLVYRRGRRTEVDADFLRLARYDRGTGEVRGLAEEWDASPDGAAFTPDGGTVLFSAQEKGRIHLFSLDVNGGTPKLLARGGTLGGPHAAGGRIVFVRQSFLAPPDLFTLALDEAGQEPRRLTSLNAARLAELDLGTAGEATFAGAGNEPVHMHLVFPPGFDPQRKYPLVHVLHGGPHVASLDDFAPYWNGALLAAQGYVVAMVNFHGSSGYGQAFADSILGNHADKPFADVMKATDWLIAQGYVDEARMAAGGGSYGGYLASWILGHTDRFAALITFAGVYDLMGQFASDTTYTRPLSYGASPWTDPKRIDRYSPSRFAGSFKTPTLILHGEKDYRVPVTQGINLHGVLQGKGVPSRIVIFPDEGHGELRPQGSVLWWKEIFAWLDRHLS